MTGTKRNKRRNTNKSAHHERNMNNSNQTYRENREVFSDQESESINTNDNINLSRSLYNSHEHINDSGFIDPPDHSNPTDILAETLENIQLNLSAPASELEQINPSAEASTANNTEPENPLHPSLPNADVTEFQEEDSENVDTTQSVHFDTEPEVITYSDNSDHSNIFEESEQIDLGGTDPTEETFNRDTIQIESNPTRYRRQSQIEADVQIASTSAAANNYIEHNIGSTSTPRPTGQRNIHTRRHLTRQFLNTNQNTDENTAIIMADQDRRHLGTVQSVIGALPFFDGNPIHLKQFTDAVQIASDSFNGTADNMILAIIPNKLKGMALASFGGRASSSRNVADFITKLTQQFGSTYDLETLKIELYGMAQEDGESIDSYANRATNIELRLLAAYDVSNPNAPDNDPGKQALRQEVVEYFLHGMKWPPEHQVAIKNPRTLFDAYSIASKLEKKNQFVSNHQTKPRTAPNPKAKKTKHPKVSFMDDSDDDSSDDTMAELISVVKDLKREIKDVKRSASIRTVTGKVEQPKKTKPPETVESKCCQFCLSNSHELKDCGEWQFYKNMTLYRNRF